MVVVSGESVKIGDDFKYQVPEHPPITLSYTKSMDVRIKLIQQKISEQEKALHKPDSELMFSEFISTINEEVSNLVKYFRKHPKQLLEYAQTHIPVQETDIFI